MNPNLFVNNRLSELMPTIFPGEKIVGEPVGTDGSNGSAGVGNTNDTRNKRKIKRIPPSKHWCFTLNNYTKDQINIIGSIGSTYCKKYVFQEENEGTPHLQGYLEFLKKSRPSGIFKIKEIHFEKTRSIKHSISYCSDIKKRTGKIWTHNIKIPKPIKILTVDQFFVWQHKIIDIIKGEPDDRNIYWFWESIGNVGKSVFCKYLVVEFGALILSGKSSDMKYGIIKYKEKHGVYPELIIMDLPRSMEDYISWAGIEEIKNACFFSPKYESDMIVGNCPHLICFANFLPDIKKLSLDRWIIKEIKIKNDIYDLDSLDSD